MTFPFQSVMASSIFLFLCRAAAYILQVTVPPVVFQKAASSSCLLDVGHASSLFFKRFDIAQRRRTLNMHSYQYYLWHVRDSLLASYTFAACRDEGAYTDRYPLQGFGRNILALPVPQMFIDADACRRRERPTRFITTD